MTSSVSVHTIQPGALAVWLYECKIKPHRRFLHGRAETKNQTHPHIQAERASAVNHCQRRAELAKTCKNWFQ